MLATLLLLVTFAASPPEAPPALDAPAARAMAPPDSTADVLPDPNSFADRVQRAYATQDADALRGLLDEADTRLDRFLALYRLYPLTQDASLLDDLPEDLPEETSARAFALLSGLWAYRAGTVGLFRAMRYGRRSVDLLEAARTRDALDPYALLVGGQSLLYRPAIAGRDVEEALERFRNLGRVLEHATDTGIAAFEARLWTWFALRQLDRAGEASSLKETLLAQNPPTLYRQFLLDPPKT
jgi:hypothetical protein